MLPLPPATKNREAKHTEKVPHHASNTQSHRHRGKITLPYGFGVDRKSRRLLKREANKRALLQGQQEFIFLGQSRLLIMHTAYYVHILPALFYGFASVSETLKEKTANVDENEENKILSSAWKLLRHFRFPPSEFCCTSTLYLIARVCWRLREGEREIAELVSDCGAVREKF